MRAFIRRLVYLGTEGASANEVRQTLPAAVVALVGSTLSAAYVLGYLVAGPRYWGGAVINVGAILAFCGILGLLARRRLRLARHAAMLAVHVQVTLVSLFLGPAVGFHYFFLFFVPLASLIMAGERRAVFVAYPMLSFALFALIQYGGIPPWAAAPPPAVVIAVNAVSSASTCGCLSIIIYLFHAEVSRAQAALEAEHARSERLLLNILPAEISERLKAGEQSIADGIEQVTVLFADIVGFTPLSSELSPRELVTLLNEIFSRFDALTEQLGLEKIKTIGDAYMVVSGVPVPRADHAEIAAEMALAMREVVRELSERRGHALEIRIGLHAGPVVAGVIGTRKFAYDLWGDTVNTASRMESHGMPGTIHVTEAVQSQLEGRYVFSLRAGLEVKGKGKMNTYFLERAAG